MDAPKSYTATWANLGLDNSLPAQQHRCAAQVNGTGDLQINFRVPKGVGVTLVTVTTDLNGYPGRISCISDVQVGRTNPSAGPWSYPNGSCIIDTDGDVITFSGFTMNFIHVGGDEYTISIDPQSGNNDWSSGSGNEEWYIKINNLETNQFQIDTRIQCNLSTSLDELLIIDVTPCRPFV